MHKTDTEFSRAGCHGQWCPASSCEAAPESPGLDSAVDGNWIQECTDWNLDRDSRQDNEQGLLQKPDMDKEDETVMIPQL